MSDLHTYTYDAENRIASVDSGSVSYLYNANGDRVEKTVSAVWTDFVHDLSGNHVTEVNAGAPRFALFETWDSAIPSLVGFYAKCHASSVSGLKVFLV